MSSANHFVFRNCIGSWKRSQPSPPWLWRMVETVKERVTMLKLNGIANWTLAASGAAATGCALLYVANAPVLIAAEAAAATGLLALLVAQFLGQGRSGTDATGSSGPERCG